MPTEIHYGEPEGDRQSQLSYGGEAVELTFNPSKNPTVQRIKELYAEIIDSLNLATANAVTEESHSLHTEAIRQAQTAQMWAVKAITYPY